MTLRFGNLVIAFVAVLALVAGSTMLQGLPYWAFTTAIVVAAAALTFLLYARRSRRWTLESYRLLGEGQLATLRERVEAELQGPSPVARGVIELLHGEVLFWSGDFDGALEKAKAIDVTRLGEHWAGGVAWLQVVAAAFGGRVGEARAALNAHVGLLETRAGYYQLQAMVALREGDAVKARELWASPPPVWTPPPMVRGAIALLQAEIALAHGEDAAAFVAEAVKLGGESFVVARAGALRLR